jgi:prepilin-type N-terminal cleavage/methylation domain-containing protein/prepilin-type processing-associated H-X9-DG protein
MRVRSAFSLLELLLAVAIVATIAAIGLAAVQRSRAAADRVACANNVRQLALGLHAYHGAHVRLPPGVRGLDGDLPCLTWAGRTLPFLSQQAAWDETREDYRRQLLFSKPFPHRNLARSFPVFFCPAGGERVGTTDEGVTAAFTYYLGVNGRIGAEWNGLLYKGSAIRFVEVTDGTSQTLLLGERPPSVDKHFGWWYAGIGMSDLDGSADSVMAVRELNRTYRAPECPRGPYKFTAGRPDQMCDMFHFWSLHPGGSHFAFADGSVRFLAYDADAVLPALSTRAGGEVVAVP